MERLLRLIAQFARLLERLRSLFPLAQSPQEEPLVIMSQPGVGIQTNGLLVGRERFFVPPEMSKREAFVRPRAVFLGFKAYRLLVCGQCILIPLEGSEGSPFVKLGMRTGGARRMTCSKATNAAW